MRVPIAIAALAAGCGGGDDKPACSLGQMSGAWVATYTETSGTCGPVDAETFLMEPGDYPGVSADRCSMARELPYTTPDGRGTYTWIIVVRQTGPRGLEGTGNLQVEHPDGGCESTYDISFREL